MEYALNYSGTRFCPLKINGFHLKICLKEPPMWCMGKCFLTMIKSFTDKAKNSALNCFKLRGLDYP